jgi:hypothetical protein
VNRSADVTGHRKSQDYLEEQTADTAYTGSRRKEEIKYSAKQENGQFSSRYRQICKEKKATMKFN